ncbi:MAG: hypothetical protein K2X06_13595 [Burkholderiales bacterium]|nr:hypothetical protein [Burkholderiales bacterium]
MSSQKSLSTKNVKPKYSEKDLRKKLGAYHAPEGLYEKTKAMSFLGNVTCNVSELVAGCWTEIVLDYTIGASGMADGAWFKATFKFYSDWALFQTTDPVAPNYVSAEYQAGPLVPGQSPATVQSLKVRFDQKGHERPFQKAIIVDTVDGYLKAGDHIIVRLGDRRFGGPGTRVQTFVEEGFRFRCYVDPLGTSRFAAVPGDIKFDIVSGAPSHLVATGSRLVRKDERFVLRVRAEDEWGNTCWNRSEKLAIRATREGREVYSKTVSPSSKGWCVAEITDLPTDKPGELAVAARLEGHPNVDEHLFYVNVDEKLQVSRVYYCGLHVHSDDTIGTNSTTYNLNYGRDVSGLDVLAFSHNDFNITTDRWNRTVELIDAINEDDRYVAYPGTEWCGSSCAGGDHNVVFLHGQKPEFPYLKDGTHVRSFEWNEDMTGKDGVEPGAWPLEELWLAYNHDPEGHLLIPHVGGRRCIMDWHYPTLERLVEIGSAWGHFGWLYEEVIRRGYKLGASAAGDEHRGRCGGGVPGTAVFGTKGCVTGLLAPKLTRKAVGEALRARHTWATTGERTVGLTQCGKHIQGDEFDHKGAAKIDYRFLGYAGWDEIAAYDHSGRIWHRDLQKEAGYSERKIRIRWGGARIKDRYRWAAWNGKVTVSNGVINSFVGRGFEHKEETCWRTGATEIGFRADTYGDAECIDIDVSNLANARIRISGTIDGYVKVGNPLDGNPWPHCPSFDWEISGAELLASDGRIRKELGGTEVFLAIERLSDAPMPREVTGTLKVEPDNGPQGFRPVFFFARQIDDAKVWTSAMFINFK